MCISKRGCADLTHSGALSRVKEVVMGSKLSCLELLDVLGHVTRALVLDVVLASNRPSTVRIQLKQTAMREIDGSFSE